MLNPDLMSESVAEQTSMFGSWKCKSEEKMEPLKKEKNFCSPDRKRLFGINGEKSGEMEMRLV